MLIIGNKKLSSNNCMVIAEAGVNHLKDKKIAEKIISAGAKSGADFIKFQTYKADNLSSKNAKRFWDWSGELNPTGSQYDSYKKLETYDYEFTKFLYDTCKKYNVEFMSTPFDLEAVDLLESLNVTAYKIASGDITNFILLDKIAKTKKPIFLSTGASNLNEINNAVNRIKSNGNNKICIMHCTLCYPTRPQHACFNAILELKSHFKDYLIGLSDHTLGPIAPLASIPLGCCIIEKHFTIDKNLPDSADHWLSLDPDELKFMVDNIKLLNQTLGPKLKYSQQCEEIARYGARRSLYSLKSIKKGEKFTLDKLIAKRPYNGICPSNIDEILEKTAAKDIDADTLLTIDMIEEDCSFKPIK